MISISSGDLESQVRTTHTQLTNLGVYDYATRLGATTNHPFFGLIEDFCGAYTLVRRSLYSESLPDKYSSTTCEAREFYSLFLASRYSSIEATKINLADPNGFNGVYSFSSIQFDVRYGSVPEDRRSNVILQKLLQNAFLSQARSARTSVNWLRLTSSFFDWIAKESVLLLENKKYRSIQDAICGIEGSIADYDFKGLNFNGHLPQLYTAPLVKHSSRVDENNDNIDPITLDDIGGNSVAKEKIRSVINCFRFRDYYEKRAGVVLPKGYLLCGPPGTGKSMFGRVMASEIGAEYHELVLQQILDPYHGMSERYLKAFLDQPGFFFMDEFDSLGRSRERRNQDITDRLVTVILNHLCGTRSRDDQVFLAATNYLEAVDVALRRPGRLVPIIIDYPTRDDLVEIFNIHAKKREKLTGIPYFREIDVATVIDSMDSSPYRFSGADVSEVINRVLLVNGQEKEPMVETNGSYDDIFPDFISTQDLLGIIEDYKDEMFHQRSKESDKMADPSEGGKIKCLLESLQLLLS